MSIFIAATFISFGIYHISRATVDDVIPGFICIVIGIGIVAATAAGKI